MQTVTPATVRTHLNRLYWWLERIIDPQTRNSQYYYAEKLRACLQSGRDWLDVGCGRRVLPEWVQNQSDLVASAKLAVGLDYTTESMVGNDQIANLIAGDVSRLPFAAETFDVVSANMVAEHLEKPKEVLPELYRILRPGGRFLFHTPNVRFYMTRIAYFVPRNLKHIIIRLGEGREEKDVFPTRYRMNDFENIYRLAESSGFRVAECRSLNTSSTSEIIIFGPFVLLVLLIRRMLQLDVMKGFRSNFIVVLEKPL